MQCLDEQTLLDFLSGRLDGKATQAARAHVAQCETCNAIATDFIHGAAAHVHHVRAPTTASSPSYVLAAGETIAGGKYRLVRPLGEGGMGVVWEASTTTTTTTTTQGAHVAIKFLKAFDAAAKKRFVREVSFKIDHPGVVRVLDVLEDVEAGCPALVMELLEGEALQPSTANVDDDPRELARALATTLAAIHDAGLVHRDVKPANIFLASSRRRFPRVVLLDLGLAKAMADDESRLTRTGQTVGTPAYMAPEQLAGERAIDARADLWSLGVVLYECLTGGTRPFPGRTVAEVLRSIAGGGSPPTAMPNGLVRALLSPDREARPASARAVLDLLDLESSWRSSRPVQS